MRSLIPCFWFRRSSNFFLKKKFADRAGKRIKSLCGAKPPQKLRWTNGALGGDWRYGDFTKDARSLGR
jgi:hypothetical protein